MIRALVVSSRLRLRGSRVQGRTRATSSSASSPAARNAVCSDHESVQDDFKSYTLAGLDHGVQMLSLVSHLQEISSIVKAALTSGTLSALGDTLAQLLVRNQLQKEHGINKSFELERTARMFSFGLLWYGPFQHYWYRALANRFPGTGMKSFGIKVVLNQISLGPIVLCTAFSWNLALQQKVNEIPAKIQKDMLPTLVNGWKFWVPAACVNFFVVPVAYQVLWMSLCGVLWTGYISFASYNSANAISIQK